MKFNKKYDFDPSIGKRLVTGPSMTIPDQTMSVAEILMRYSRGQPFQAGKPGSYLGDDDDLLDGVDINSLDIEEKHQVMRRNVENIERMLKERQKEYHDSKKRWTDAVEKKIKEMAGKTAVFADSAKPNEPMKNT